MARFIDLSNKKIGSWHVIQRVYREKGKTHWLCRCSCGHHAFVISSHLLGGKSTKCKRCHNIQAVKARPSKHGHCKKENSHEYRIWNGMKNRCLNPKADQFHNYGARGIKICDEWINDFMKFLEDMGQPPAEMSLDRIDTNGNYSKENCRWATFQQQCENKRTNKYLEFNGEKKTYSAWAKHLKIPYTSFKRHVDRGNWPAIAYKQPAPPD